MQLSPVTQKFVLHWGEMGTRWGVNRTVAQIHGLLYLAERPLTAEDIAAALGVARSNVSVSLRELQTWGLIRVTHQMGDRRDHFAAVQDVWEIFRTIVEERKRREIDPTLTMLRDCVVESENDSQLGETGRVRLQAMLDLVESLTEGYDELKRLPPTALFKLLLAGSRIQGWLGRAGKAGGGGREA